MYDPDNVTKPSVSVELARSIFHELYGFKVQSMVELNSYDDRNFRVELLLDAAADATEGCRPMKEAGSQWLIMKVINSIDSDDPRGLVWQNKVMKFLSQKGLCVQNVVLSLTGKDFEMTEIQTEINTQGDVATRRHAVRVLTYIPGQILGMLPDASVEFNEKVGRFFGQFTEYLQMVPDHQQIPKNPTIWNLSCVPQIQQYFPHISGQERRNLLASIVDWFKQSVLPVEESLMRGLIHGDLNEQNILVHQSETGNDSASSWEVCGVLDWQDLSYSFIVYELALLVAYRIIALKITSSAMLEVGAATIRGYQSAFPALPAYDRQLLPVLVMSRFAQSLCMGEYTAKVLQPGNDYILVTADKGWDQLKYLYEHREQCQAAWTG